MSCPVSIVSVLQRVGASPGFRNSAAELFTGLPDGICEVVLNFEGVSFISRGFADELHQERLRLQRERSISVTVEQAVEEVRATMAAVARTQDVKPSRQVSLPVIRVAGQQDLEDLLLGS